MPEPHFTVVAVFGSVADGEMACSQLRAAGIEGRLDDAQTVSVLPLHSLAIGGIRLVVAAADGDRAREVLGVMEKGAPDEETEPEGTLLLREGDAWMRRAAIAGGFGNFVPVIATAYSVGILIKYGGRAMTERGRRLRTLAIVFDVAAVLIMGFVVFAMSHLGEAPAS